MLLIAPEGIEIAIVLVPAQRCHLLIAPEGIEIHNT